MISFARLQTFTALTVLVFLALLSGATVTVNAANSKPATSNHKLHQDLSDAADYFSGLQNQTADLSTTTTSSYATAHRLTVINNKILVEIFLADTSAAYISTLENYGIVRDASFGRVDNILQAMVPLNQLNALAGEQQVRWVAPPARPQLLSVSEGVAITGATTYQAHVPPINGSGVKVAIIDIGFQQYQSLLGSSLPSTVTAISFRADGDINGGSDATPHGTACAEIIHEMAPDAQLYLMNVQTLNDLMNAVQYCINQNVKVISHSVGWLNLSFYDGTGPMKTIVDSATNAGILWCNASGNEQTAHWDGTFSDPDGNGFENFSATDEDININLTAGTPCGLSLTWDEWPLATSDFDLFIYQNVNGTLQEVAASTIVQDGTQPPTEEIYYTPSQSGVYHIKIGQNSGGAVRLALFVSEPYSFAEYNVPAHSLMDPAPVASAFTVGAVNAKSNTIEFYSSLGPTMDGRLKPDISGPDCTSGAIYGASGFCGTSAATPHVAGAAALLLSQDPSRSVNQVKTLLQKSSMDLGAVGPDDSYGAGRLLMPSLTTAVEESQIVTTPNGIAIYPNPVSVGDQLRVLANNISGATADVTLFDALGRTMVHQAVANPASTLNVPLTAPMTAGSYYCRIVDGSKISSAYFTVIK